MPRGDSKNEVAGIANFQHGCSVCQCAAEQIYCNLVWQSEGILSTRQSEFGKESIVNFTLTVLLMQDDFTCQGKSLCTNG